MGVIEESNKLLNNALSHCWLRCSSSWASNSANPCDLNGSEHQYLAATAVVAWILWSVVYSPRFAVYNVFIGRSIISAAVVTPLAILVEAAVVAIVVLVKGMCTERIVYIQKRRASRQGRKLIGNPSASKASMYSARRTRSNSLDCWVGPKGVYKPVCKRDVVDWPRLNQLLLP